MNSKNGATGDGKNGLHDKIKMLDLYQISLALFCTILEFDIVGSLGDEL